MSERLIRRYLFGLISNRVGQNFWLQEKMLPDGQQRRIYSDLYQLMEQGSEMTPEVVVDKLSRHMGDEQAEDFVKEALNSDTTMAQTRELHNRLLDGFVKSEAQVTLTGIAKNINTPGAIDDALASIRRLKAMQPVKAVSLGRQTSSAVKEALDGKSFLIPYGIEALDRRIGGGTRKEITIIAARPGHGKTSFANQLVLNWVYGDQKVVVFSLEMPTNKLIHKMLSNQARIDGRLLRTGDFDDDEKDRFMKAAQDFVGKFSNNLLIYDDVHSTQEMETIIAKHKPDVVVIDFVQLMQMDQMSIRLELFRIMRTFKFIAKEYNCNFHVLSQLNRSLENREDPRPRLSDLAESGALEQLAGDVIFLYYKHKVDQNASPNRVDLYASKTRYGEPCHVRLGFQGQFMRYYQLGGEGDPNARQDEGQPEAAD